jgi:type II secretory pathway component PulF
VNMDKQFARGMSAMIDNENTIMIALDAVAKNDQALLASQLEDVPSLVTEGEEAKANLDTAVEEREAALNQC